LGRAGKNLALWGLAAALLAGCNLPSRLAAPAASATLADGTVAAVLTLIASPSLSFPGMDGPTGQTPSPGTHPTTGSPTGAAPQCEDRAAFVSDVTIRDGSELAPGQAFIKIWRLENTGTCTWSSAYSLVFFGGERMGAPPTVPLSVRVQPGMRVDLPVDLVAPGRSGTFQGFWRLRNASGDLFGIGPAGDQSFWVKIVVTATTLPVIAAAPSPTPSPTPVVIATGSVEMAPNDTVDLDGGGLNPPAGADLAYREVSPTERTVEPQNGAQLALLGQMGDAPTASDCLAAPFGSAPLAAGSWSPGTWICYQTDQGRTGYLAATLAEGVLRATYLTWGP
jgi:hypothetical protein